MNLQNSKLSSFDRVSLSLNYLIANNSRRNSYTSDYTYDSTNGWRNRLVLPLTEDCEILSDAGDLLGHDHDHDHDHDCNFQVAECKPWQNVQSFHIHSTSLSSSFGRFSLLDSAHEPFQRESSHHRCIFRPFHGKRLPHRVHLQTERKQTRADCGPPRHREEGRISQTHARVLAWSHSCPDFRRKLSTFWHQNAGTSSKIQTKSQKRQTTMKLEDEA